jgi:hypothetical protein
MMLLAILAGCRSEEGQPVSAEVSNARGGGVAGTAGAETPASGTGVVGQLRNASGGAIELATITVTPHPAAGSGPVTLEANVSDAEGHYFHPLPPGRWNVTVTAHGYRPVSSLVVVSDGDPASHDLVLERLASGQDDEGADATG